MYQKDLTYKEIVKLPDYPALEKLASALWQQENNYHGAAIMVGAGFSRSAASTGDVSRQLPLWNDLSAMLAAKLSTTSSDPLRLAEEYSAYFGKPALHDLVKKCYQRCGMGARKTACILVESAMERGSNNQLGYTA